MIADLSLRPEAKALLDEYSSDSGDKARAVFLKTDVTDWLQLSRMFSVAVQEFGAVDIVCPGAGIFDPSFSSFWEPPGSSESQDAADGGALFEKSCSNALQMLIQQQGDTKVWT